MTYKQVMRKLDDERRLAMRAEFDINTQPKPAMPIKTKCERVQPYAVEGFNDRGELDWVGLEMPRWQMEMLRFMPKFFSDFFYHWREMSKYEKDREEFKPEDAYLDSCKAATPARLAEMRRMYPRKTARKHVGD